MTNPRLVIDNDKGQQQPFADDVTDREPEDMGGGGGDGGAADAGAGKCPVEALGQLGGIYYFRSGKGEIHSLAESKLFSRAGITRLFDGTTAWLFANFPVYGKPPKNQDGQATGEPPIVGWSFTGAAEFLMRECAAKPLWDPSAPQRERGVWVVGDSTDPAATVMVHCGDEVGEIVHDARSSIFKWHAPGFRAGGAIYYAASPVVHPADLPASEHQAETFLGNFRLWEYQQRGTSIVVAGLVCNGMYGQAAPWRSHGIGVAQPGSGKSFLAALCEAATPLSLFFNEFTEAGVRQAMTAAARLVILDEAEGDRDDRGRSASDRAVEFLRRLSGGAGARGVRGSTGGQAMRSAATGAAILFAVRAPFMDAQDDSRFTRFDITPLHARADPTPVLKAIAATRKAAPSLWARMLLGRRRYLKNLDTFRTVLSKMGCAPRQLEQIGVILSAYCTMESDAAVTEAYAQGICESVRWAIKTETETADDNGPARCWHHLMTAQPDVWGGGAKRTVGQILSAARSSGALRSDRDHLQSIGLRLADDNSGVFVANQAGGLVKIFAGTVWAGGKWPDDLRYLDGARPGKVRIGGATSKGRSWFIPEKHLPPPEGAEDDAAPAPPIESREIERSGEDPPF